MLGATLCFISFTHRWLHSTFFVSCIIFALVSLAQRLSAFVRDSSICVTVHWNISNSAFEATARLTFFCLGYDALRTRLSITVGSSAGHDLDGGSNGVADTGAPGIFVHCPDPPHTCHLGTDLAQLDALLRHQVYRAFHC
ncbi:unnamed protein product [Protopolystoma xenopodis]|uniref:Uncharacterized protein n=1 Tax=Protopolystoma xenopodis TaxID=117903 RepID=A0A3S5CEL1_9PLAT|nr:unnamed protein product [Protopolystoma xenopodis]